MDQVQYTRTRAEAYRINGYAVLADAFFAGQAFSCRKDKVIAGVKGNCCSLCGHNGVMRLAACAPALSTW